MAIVWHMHKPDLFITMTCNPNWPEIQAELSHGQSAQDRHAMVARLFRQKKDQLMKDLTQRHVLGKCQAWLWVIEFQKRGLPHIHILLILQDQYRPKTAELVDQMVLAEPPPDPNETGITYDEKARQKPLWDIVLTNMIHGLCNDRTCLENGKCTKMYPKPYKAETLFDPETSHPAYRHRSQETGGISTRKMGRTIDNSWIVPCNPFMSLRYNCHINVEMCASPLAAKYLYKYVTKGPDCAMVTTEAEGARQRDEIKNYEHMCSIRSCDASWHLFAFPKC